MKYSVFIFSIIAILIISSASLMTSPIKATNVSMQYGHLQDESDTTELQLEYNICDYVYDKFNDDPYKTCGPVNCYRDYTTSTYVGQCLDWQRNNANYVTNWWVGDYHPSSPATPAPFGHIWFYGNNGADISDDYIHDHITNNGYSTSKEYFTFIWTCVNGGRWWSDSYGNSNQIEGITTPAPTIPPSPPDNTNTYYGFWNPWNNNYGMPFAFTGRLDMNLDGFNNDDGDYCVIGWEGPSPFMKEYNAYVGHYCHEFIEQFYNKALGYENYGYHQTIHASLNYASQYFYGCDFDETPLGTGWWCQSVYGNFYVTMRVLGNSYLTIP
jgi:hypothetical protein